MCLNLTRWCIIGLVIKDQNDWRDVRQPQLQGIAIATFCTLYCITLEFLLEWLKYKTAKLLLYTVYRTRHRKQLGVWKTVRKTVCSAFFHAVAFMCLK